MNKIMTDKTLSEVIAELEETCDSYKTIKVIRTLVKREEVLRKALEFYSQCEENNHGEDTIADKALSLTDPNQPWKG